MNEVEIPLKITGIGAIKKELRDLKGEIANATDPKQITELAQKAGELTDRLKDANEQVRTFATGSKFEQVSNGIGGIKDSIMSLDFEEAAEKAKVFQTAVSGISSKDISGSFKGLISTVSTLGQTFVRFGVMLFTNPIFLLVTVITAIVAAVVIFLNKIGILQKAFDILMIPVNAVIQAFKDMTDFLGLTDHAGEELAKNEKKRQEELTKLQAEKNAEILREIEAKEKLDKANKDYQQAEIAFLESQGKSAQTLKKQTAEQAVLEAKIAKANEVSWQKATAFFEKEEESKAKLIAADTEILKAQANLNNVVKEGIEKQKEFNKARLDAARLIKDLELSLVKDATEKELRENQVKYDRLIADTKKNEKLNAEEKKKINNFYEQIKDEEDAKIQKKAKDDQLKRATELSDELALRDKEKRDREQAGLLQDAQKRIEARNLIKDITQTENEKEIETLKLQFEERLAVVKGNLEQEAIVRQDYANKIKLIEIGGAEKRRQAILSLATTTNEGLNQLGQIFINDQKKLAQFQKATALIQIGIDTAKAISSLVAAAQANPFNGVSAGAAGIAQFATGVVQILTNMAKAKQLLSNPSSAPSGGGGNISGGNQATATAQATPAINLFGQGNQLNQVGSPTSSESNQNITVQAIVSETEVTSTQTKIDKIKKNAEL